MLLVLLSWNCGTFLFYVPQMSCAQNPLRRAAFSVYVGLWDFSPVFSHMRGSEIFSTTQTHHFFSHTHSRYWGKSHSPTSPAECTEYLETGAFLCGAFWWDNFQSTTSSAFLVLKGAVHHRSYPPLRHPAADAARRNPLPYHRCALSLYSPCFLCRSDPWTLNAPTEP